MLISKMTIYRGTQISKAENEKDKKLDNSIFHFIPILEGRENKINIENNEPSSVLVQF